MQNKTLRYFLINMLINTSNTPSYLPGIWVCNNLLLLGVPRPTLACSADVCNQDQGIDDVGADNFDYNDDTSWWWWSCDAE